MPENPAGTTTMKQEPSPTSRIDPYDITRPIIDWTAAAERSLLSCMKTCAIGQVVKPANISRNATFMGLLFVVGLLLSACRPQVEVAKDNPASGVYTLVTVNGSEVPTVVSHEGAKLRVLSGTFTINPDGTCISKMVFVPPSGAETTREVSATYTQDGRTLNMEWKGAGRTTGTIEGNTFNMNNEGMDFAYRMQP